MPASFDSLPWRIADGIIGSADAQLAKLATACCA
jgi:hypothetical protein